MTAFSFSLPSFFSLSWWRLHRKFSDFLLLNSICSFQTLSATNHSSTFIFRIEANEIFPWKSQTLPTSIFSSGFGQNPNTSRWFKSVIGLLLNWPNGQHSKPTNIFIQPVQLTQFRLTVPTLRYLYWRTWWACDCEHQFVHNNQYQSRIQTHSCLLTPELVRDISDIKHTLLIQK